MSDIHARKESAALASIGASAAIAIGKLIAGLMSGSLALLSEAGHASVDTGATILTWLAVRASGKPADEEHHYGHGKYELLAALAETGLLFALTAFVVIEAVRRLDDARQDVEPKLIAFLVLGVSIVIDLVRWTFADAHRARNEERRARGRRAAFFERPSRLSAGAGRTDGHAVRICAGRFLGCLRRRDLRRHRRLSAGTRTVDSLLDRAPEGAAQRIREGVLAVPGVTGVDFLRLRPAGAQVLGEIGIGVSRTLPMERVARIAESVTQAIKEKEPEAELTLTTTPVALDNETALERVLLAAARQRRAVHHVTVQEVDGRRSVSLDLELDGQMPHGAGARSGKPARGGRARGTRPRHRSRNAYRAARNPRAGRPRRAPDDSSNPFRRIFAHAAAAGTRRARGA